MPANKLRATASAILVTFLGYAAGMQLSKIASLIVRMEAEWGLSLVFSGWLASLLGLFVALAAYPATVIAKRVGLRTSLFFGAGTLALGAIGFGLFTQPAPLLIMRMIEAVGYVVICVAAPAYLAIFAPERLRGMFLALWGSFVPVGYLAANAWVSYLPDTWSIQELFLSFAAPMAIMTLALFILPHDQPSTAQSAARKNSRIPFGGFLLALAFALYVYCSLAFFTFLPKLLVSMPTSTNTSPEFISLAVPLANFAAAFILAYLGTKTAIKVSAFGFFLVFITGVMMFALPTISAWSLILHAFGGGFVASAIFASVPLVTQDDNSAALTVGVIAQSGGLTTVFAAPFAGYLIESWGWMAWVVSLILTAALGFVANVLVRAKR